ncbi:hypothetical protein [Endozoicomonas sp. Mp262]|uniref:hypothetical protein n=1 Tax=Endozoicomonas sp. Mp262 TaxID=2919499 RepID=UPI0021D84C94
MNDIKSTAAENSIFDLYDKAYLEEQRKLFEEERTSQKQTLYNQMAINEHQTSFKDRNSRLAAIVAKHRLII